MQIDFREIFSAWKAKLNPERSQEELAGLRLEACSSCEFAKSLMGTEGIYCSKCGCLLKAKIFTPREGACPEGKWDSIDQNYRNTNAIRVLKNPKSPLV